MSRPSGKLNAANTLHNLCAQYVVNQYREQSFFFEFILAKTVLLQYIT